MRSYVSLIIEHPNHVEDLAEKIAGRAYTLSGVDAVEIVSCFPALTSVQDLEQLTNGHDHAE